MIFFNVKEVREFLINNGFVYTLRKKRFKVGNDIAVYGSRFKQKRIGKVYISEEVEVTSPIELVLYSFYSGLFPTKFSNEYPPSMTLEDVEIKVSMKWLGLAKKLSGDELYLYKVELI